MKESDLISILQNTPLLKARQIAKMLGIDRSEVNSFLYHHPDLFVQDEEYRWFLKKSDRITVTFESNKWVDCGSFEASLKASGCLMSSPCKCVVFIVTNECKLLLEAAARLLALCNQLVLQGKTVTLDFSSCDSTRTYFDRIGFLDMLGKDVEVIPSRPEGSAAERYKGNSNTVVEFGEINIHKPDKNIPKLLKEQFIVHAGSQYNDAAFTIFSELFANVCEHSNTPIPGFAALQKYGNRSNRHVQTVVSDSGDGIVGTLRPVLAEHYPKLAARFKAGDQMSDARLLKEVLEKGGISQMQSSDDEGRGLGLKSSQEYAVKYNADISVRQETLEIKLSYRGGKLIGFTPTINMPKIRGTHVCFDFFLD